MQRSSGMQLRVQPTAGGEFYRAYGGSAFVRSYLEMADSAGGEDAVRVVGAQSLSAALPLEGRRRLALRRTRHVARLLGPDELLLLVTVREPRLV